MLLQFAAENFLSFHEETLFSMLAPEGADTGAVEVTGHPGLRVMRVAALYGANASGKSNLVAAMRAGSELIARGVAANERLPSRPFKLAADSRAKPSHLQFDFVVDATKYSYTIEFTAESVRAEALYRVRAGAHEEVVFEREAPENDGEHKVLLGDALRTGDENDQFVRFVARGTRVNQPMLTEFAQRNVEAVLHAWRWFGEGVQTVAPTQPFRDLRRRIHREADLRDFCSQRLAQMGTGVGRIEVRTRPASVLEKLTPNPLYTPHDTRLRASSRLDDALESVRQLEFGFIDDQIVAQELILHHESDGGSTEFGLDEESDGTQRLLHLLPVLYYATRGDRTVIVDELDRSLHTALTRRYVEDFNAAAQHGGVRSQLIFTTHDTNLLNGRLVPPASIWFVEKDPRGATRLHSLAEYRAEQLTTLLDHLEDGYLQGRFGAIPFLAPRDELYWAADVSGAPK
jgi:AAA15 family ATPase/GTPase